jgi:hypothetical protein
VARARTKTTTERRARATSDCSSLTATNRSTAPYLLEASSSKNRSYITDPGFHLPKVLDVA